MKNKITNLFESISIEELKQAITEIEQDNLSGYICDGVVRKYSKKVQQLTGNVLSLDLYLTTFNLQAVASKMWLKSFDEQK
jgi:hypothetical protein